MFLKGISTLPTELKTFIDSTSDEELKKTFFEHIVWDLGEKPLEILEANVKKALAHIGLKYAAPIAVSDSSKAFPALMFKIIDEIITPQSQGLTQLGFHTAYLEQVLTIAQQIRALHTNPKNGSTSIIKEDAEAAKNNYFVDIAVLQNTFTEPPLILSDSVPRRSLIDQVSKTSSNKSVTFVIGSSGVGKTTLASHYLKGTHRNEKWLDLRGLDPGHIKKILKDLNTLMHLQPDEKNIFILDDLDLRKGYRDYEHELKLVLFNAVHSHQEIIITCQTEPPQRLLHDTWLTAECFIRVPYFDLDEIEEIALANGCTPIDLSRRWANIIYFGTYCGHPQLVRARIWSLKAENWTFDESDFIEPKAVKDEKKMIREQLISEIPERARDLAYRLSLIFGTFSRNMVDILGELDPKVNMSGEAFEMLVGPWIEKPAVNRYRVSPLLSGQGEVVFNENERRQIHVAICTGYLKQETPLNQNEVSKLFMHGMISNDGGVLTAIVKGTLKNLFEKSRDDILKYVADELVWFYLIAAEKGQRIFKDNLHLNFLLRIIQYKFFCLSNEGDDASILAERLLDDTKAAIEVRADDDDRNEVNEIMVYITLMSSTEKRIRPNLIVPILPRFAELAVKHKNIFPNTNDLRYPLLARKTEKDYFDPVNIALVAHTLRGNGTTDLEEFFDCIEGLEEIPRSFMIKKLKENPDIVRSLCNTWVKELSQKEEKDISPLIKVYEKGVLYGEQWGTSHLKLHCILTLSVLYNEYADNMTKALAVLEKYKGFLKDFKCLLINQKAKILFTNKKYEDAKLLWEETLSFNELDDIDKVFALKNTSISFAKSGDWSGAIDYMQERLDHILKLKKEDVFEFFDIGIVADIAFADWKLGRWERAINGFSQALNKLEKLEKTKVKNLSYVAVYARTGHMISWVAQDADAKQTLAEPPPCWASNLECNELFEGFRVRPAIYFWYFLSSAEKKKDVDTGATKEFLKKGKDTEFTKAKLLSELKEIDIAFKEHNYSNIVKLSASLLRIQKTLESSNAEIDEGIYVIIDTLCDFEDLDQNILEQFIFDAVFVACVTLCMNEKTPIQFVEQWEQQIKDLGLENSDILSEFLAFIKQYRLQMQPFSACKHNKLDQCKFVIESIPLLLTPSESDPVTLFHLHFYITNALETKAFKQHLEKGLIEAVKNGWIEVSEHKSFALNNPRLNIPRIKQVCKESTSGSISDVASILLLTSECVNVSIPESTKKYLTDIIERSNL